MAARRRLWRGLGLALLSLALLCGAVRGADTPAEAPTANTAAKPAPAGEKPTAERQATLAVSGDRVTLDLRGVYLFETLRIISEKTGMKFVVTADLANTPLSVYLSDVPIQEALRAILSANGLYMEKMGAGDIYLVKSLDKAPPLSIAVITCKHVEAKQIEQVVKSNLSPKGQVVIDKRGNALVVRDTEESIALVRRIVASLDNPAPQVLIRSHIVEIDVNAEKQLGIDWGNGVGGPLTIAARGSAQSWTWPFARTRPWIFNTPRPGEGGGDVELKPTFVYGLLDFTGLTAALKMMEDKRVAKVLASPSVAARNDQEATIKITRHMALTVQTVFDDQGNPVQRVPIYGDVGITLVTRPWVNEDGLVTLQIEPTVSSAERSSFFEEAVDTKTRTAKTEVTVPDRAVVVIGGLLRTDQVEHNSKVPLLGDIPLVGRAFRFEGKQTQETDLVIFVSPLVMRNDIPIREANQEVSRLRQLDTSGEVTKNRTPERLLFELPGVAGADMPGTKAAGGVKGAGQ